jgi:opacity protein-like surface antigen
MIRSAKAHVRAAVVLLLIGGSANPASADWLFTPFIGATLAPNAEFSLSDLDDNIGERVTFGASATWMGAGIIGFAIDFGSTPNFFEVDAGPNDFDFGDGNVTTLMGNLVIGAPIGGQSGPGLRPYVSGGFGLFRTNIDAGDIFESVNSNDFGTNVGGGLHIFFTDDIGINGDIRYFRALQQDDDEFGFEDFDFWRVVAGLTVRFGG